MHDSRPFVCAAIVAVALVVPGITAASATQSSQRETAATGVGSGICVKTVDGAPFAPGAAMTPCEPVAGGPAGWRLVWSDEFDGGAVDGTKWNVLDDSTYGEGNLELACLTRRPENVRVGAGVLTISARRESSLRCGADDTRFPRGRSYSSGHLETKQKASFEYGRFEVRAQSPTAFGTSKGIWPAFWMRPVTGGVGEIDILENIGTSITEKNRANRTNQTIHHDYVTYPRQGSHYDLPAGTFADGMHTYAVEWEPGSLRWYIDGVLAWERNRATTPWLDEAFDGPFYLRLNLSVGGNWPGSPDPATVFPADFVIDYVRVYQR